MLFLAIRAVIEGLAVLLLVQTLLPLPSGPWATAAGAMLVAPMLVGRLVAVLRRVERQTRRHEDRPGASDRERMLGALRTHAALAVLDHRGRFIELSDPLCRLLGQTRSAWLGRGHRRLVRGALDRRRWRELRCVVTSGRPWRGELVKSRPEGGLLGADVTVVPLIGPDGRPHRYLVLCHDIARHHQAEQTLEQTNAMLRGILENLPCGLAVFDARLDLVICNAEYRQLLDLPESLFEAPVVSYEHIVRCEVERGDYGAGDPQALVEARIEIARQPLLQQVEHVREDGLTIDIRSVPLPGGGFVTTHLNITGHKLTETLLRGAIDAVNEAFVVYDPQDRLVFCNDKYRELYATSADLILPGSSFEAIVRAGAERGQYRGALGRIEDWVAERMAVHRAADGVVEQQLDDGRWLRIIERRMPDGHLVGFRIDITELVLAREQAEAASRESRNALARLQAIHAILPVGITVTDPFGEIIDCNPASERMLGLGRSEHVGRGCDDARWRILREDGSLMPAEEYPGLRALRSGQPVHDAIMQVLSPDQQHRVWLSVSAMPAAHEALGVVIGYVDISEQRAQHQALTRAKAQAEEASIAKSQFLANMSHEIRTPMNAVLGMLRLLQGTALSPAQRDYADKAGRAARAMLGLLDDILDFSKIEAGKLELDSQPFALEQMMRDLSDLVAASVGERALEVIFDIDPATPPRLVCDALRLQQVLINLLGNAIKFTPAGEIRLSVRPVMINLTDVLLEFAVADTGIGIAPEHRQRIFSGFAQAEASTTRRFGGTGLGLSISQRLVTLMGAEMRLDSEPGRGSRFSFELMLEIVDDESDEGDPPEAGAAPVPQVLIVDDHAGSREALLAMVGALGWPAQAVAEASAAIEIVRQGLASGPRISLALIDGLPVQAARALCRTLRGHDEDMLLLSLENTAGRVALAAQPLSQRDGLDGCLVRPVIAPVLRDTVAAVAAQRRGECLPSARPEPVRRLAGLRLLVVEDNPNNQQVARELLEGEGASVTIAGDGAQGVQVLSHADPMFDLVLMDLQMPVMDGLTAAARIRRDLGLTTLPVVAMTANAMASDRAACLAAGMNDHVGKPFDLDRLAGLLLRLTGRGVAQEAVEPVAPVGRAPASPLPEALRAQGQHAGIDLDTALERMSGRADVLHRMAVSLAGSLQEARAHLAAHLARGRQEEAVRLLHSLKGLTAMLGADALSRRLAEAERALAQGLPPPGGSTLQAWPAHLAEPLATFVTALLALLAAWPQDLPAREAGARLSSPD